MGFYLNLKIKENLQGGLRFIFQFNSIQFKKKKTQTQKERKGSLFKSTFRLNKVIHKTLLKINSSKQN